MKNYRPDAPLLISIYGSSFFSKQKLLEVLVFDKSQKFDKSSDGFNQLRIITCSMFYQERGSFSYQRKSYSNCSPCPISEIVKIYQLTFSINSKSVTRLLGHEKLKQLYCMMETCRKINAKF